LELPLLSLLRLAAAAHLLFPFLLLARSKNGLSWVPRIVLSREFVSPGDMKEMHGGRDFPVLLEETAAGMTFICFLEETDKGPSAVGLRFLWS
jgi:hypothetical protein